MKLHDQHSKAVLDVPDMGADGPEGMQVQALFDKQKAYFATDVTKRMRGEWINWIGLSACSRRTLNVLPTPRVLISRPLAIQNCWRTASRNPPHFEYEGAFRSWLVRIIIDEALAILRESQGRGTQPRLT